MFSLCLLKYRIECPKMSLSYRMLSKGLTVHRLLKAGFASDVKKWDIFTAVCVERLPVVTPSLNEIQSKFKTYLDEHEAAISLKSDHELQHEQDIIYAEKLKSDAEDLDTVSKITAQDFEDACVDEVAKFEFASIETEADKKNDQKSLERKLQSHLVLLVEQKIGNEKKYIFPQGQHHEGETLRQTAERVFNESCGSDINALFFGNAPCGYYKYKYRDQNNETKGVKVFFYYAQHKSGQVQKEKQYKWLARNELESILPKPYHLQINEFLVDERV